MYHNCRILAISLLVLTSFSSFAQQNFKSPYSLFGVGVLHYDGFADNIAVGRTGEAYRFESNFTFANPASLSALKQSAFNVGTYIDVGQHKTKTLSQKFTNSGFNYISLGVPIAKLRGGLAFGMLPFSDVGYNITNVKDSSGVSVRNEYEGYGGLSKFNIGFGSNVWKGISLGINYSYIFGQVEETQRRRYPGSRYMMSYAEENSLFLKGSHIDVGLHYHDTSKSGMSHLLGVVWSSGTNLKAEQDRFAYSFTEYFTSTEIIWDTVFNFKGNKANVSLPSSIKLAYAIGNHEKWQLMAGFSNTNWNSYKDIFGSNNGFTNDQKYSLGFFVCPNPIFDRTVKSNRVVNYLKSIRYSVGGHHSTGYIEAFGTKITESGITAGFGFPFTRVHKRPDQSRVLITSRIFLTGEYVRRGTVNNNLIQEDFFRLTLGLNFSDNWFNKRLFN